MKPMAEIARSPSRVCSHCGRPASAGDLCSTHRRRKRLKLPMDAPIRGRGSPSHAELKEAAIRYADADSENDADALIREKALEEVARAFGRKEHHHLIAQGLWRRKAAGLPVGRPPKVTRAQAEAAVAKYGSRAAAAQALEISRQALWRALSRRVAKPKLSQHRGRAWR